MRIRAKIKGTSGVPRIAVYRSNKHIYAQMIDDSTGRTLCASSDLVSKSKNSSPLKKRAEYVGEALAKKALAKKIKKAIFDRGGFSYKGNIKVLAESMRENGIVF
jgi:large subunit ribosomal protein L18